MAISGDIFVVMMREAAFISLATDQGTPKHEQYIGQPVALPLRKDYSSSKF